MDYVLSGIKPEIVFRHFEGISQIPRCSGNEKTISNYLVKFAKDNDLEVIQDESLNVIIKKPATRGYEKAPTVILQGHMDMVCEKDKKTKHDFGADPIEFVVENDFIRANGTTLGADNGIAIAICLTLLESNDIAHPSLEVLLTTGEEIGMKGAAKVDKQHLSGKILINMDSEEEGVFLVSCAGGITLKIKININLEDVEDIQGNGKHYKIIVNGLKGGHSGIEIDKGRGNANKIVGRILDDLQSLVDYRILSINGGSMNNAIAKEAEAIIYIANNKDIDLQDFSTKWNDILKNQLNISDPEIKVSIGTVNINNNKILDKNTTEKIVSLMQLIPNGIHTMSMEIDNLVESSSNLGVIKTLDNFILFDISIRSSIKTLKYELVNKIKKIANLMDAEIILEGDYPEWAYRYNSEIRKIFKKVYSKKYGKEPKITAMHAGLECGLLNENLGDIDMISLGPNIYDAHTINERLSISSVERTWEFLLAVLKEIQ